MDITSLSSQTRSGFTGTDDQWDQLKTVAAFVIIAGSDETIYAESIDMEDALAANKEPYGDVPYSDPGYQPDKKKRYPISDPEKIRAAWSYIHQEKNAAKYTSSQLAKIKARIVSAWKKKIDPKGPPSA